MNCENQQEVQKQQLPDPKLCRTKWLRSGLYNCLVKCPESCPHVVRFGWGYFCDHPQPELFQEKD